MPEFTPTTEEVRRFFWGGRAAGGVREYSARSAAFDRWLEEHDRKVAFDAWEACSARWVELNPGVVVVPEQGDDR